jgi:hypothetical protein
VSLGSRSGQNNLDDKVAVIRDGARVRRPPGQSHIETVPRIGGRLVASATRQR